MKPPLDSLLQQLAGAAGLLTAWRDAQGSDRQVDLDTLRSVLRALEIACESESQCRDSLRSLRDEARQPASLLVVKSGAPVVLRRDGSLHYRLQLEEGTVIMGTARDLGGGYAAIHGIQRPGYHRLEMGRVRMTIAVAPPRCPSVSDLVGRGHAWVIGAQVYSLRRRTRTADPSQAGRAGTDVIPGWEVGGDFSAVGRLAREAVRHGASGLALSPVHAMFTADACRHSPYSPSSRLFLNAMHADPAAVLGADMIDPLMQHEFAARVDVDGCMDWPAIQTQRLAQLRRLYDCFITRWPPGPAEDFNAFRRQGGEALADHACYEALHAHHVAELGPGHGWQDWPAGYRSPDSAAVRRFALLHDNEVRFHAFLQWLAVRSLADAHAGARAAGMPIGLIADMAVGTDPKGSHAWCRQGQLMTGVSVGAPPDAFQSQGQNWGLTAFSPRALRLHGYGGFIETLRAVLAHAGGVRVDHVIGLERMWLVPAGARPGEGAYLRYPRDDLMDLLALEAWRHRALVIGENLGTVPEGFNEILAQRGMLGTSVLWFEQDPGELPAFRAREYWPASAMAMVTTHDLPTLCGWWCGRDIRWRERLGQYDHEQAAAERALRRRQKRALWAALQDAGLAGQDAPEPEEPPSAGVLAYVASVPAVLFNVALEDLLRQVEQPNLPAGGQGAAGHPDWRRTLGPAVDELLADPEVSRLLNTVQRARQEAAAAVGPPP